MAPVSEQARSSGRERRHGVVETVTREELKAKMDRGEDFVLVDALGREHYESSHLPGRSTSPTSSWMRREGYSPTRRPRSSSTA